MTKVTWPYGYIRNNDAAIYYEVHKSTQQTAPYLFMLHGNDEDMHIFDDHIAHLLPHYNVITLDTQGHGKSVRGSSPLSYSLFAEDLFALVNKLHIGNFLIMGFSDGGNTALELALAHPERICAMILIGANLSPDGLTTKTQLTMMAQKTLLKMQSVINKEKLLQLELVELMIGLPQIDAAKLADINIPTLVICGEHDMVKSEHSALIAKSLPNARLLSVKGAGHFVMKDAPEAFDRAVLDFLMEED